jgi:hypothetical protein
MANYYEKPEVGRAVPFDVRETRRLSRLTSAATFPLSRQTAIVAADTEDEARLIEYTHNAFGRNSRDPGFAVCDAVDPRDPHPRRCNLSLCSNASSEEEARRKLSRSE